MSGTANASFISDPSLSMTLPPHPVLSIHLLQASRECSERGLYHSAKWCAELAASIESDFDSGDLSNVRLEGEEIPSKEAARVALGKSYFDVKEFDRCSHTLKSCVSPLATFLRFYSTYLAGEKRKEDQNIDLLGTYGSGESVNDTLSQLRLDLDLLFSSQKIDGYSCYLYGIILKNMSLTTEAAFKFAAAIQLTPYHWGAWMELASLFRDVKELHLLERLNLPDHWMRRFFQAYIALEFQQNEEAIERYSQLQNEFPNSCYLKSQCALAFYNAREFEASGELFRDVMKMEPFRVDHLDVYSNILFVTQQKADLSFLAHNVAKIDPYRAESCCVIANYYSLRGDHDKAVLYFQRALKLNRNYLSAWTLMGHEYVELKNPAAAIEAYRRAVDVNPRDYRAWHGLGQAYEFLKMGAFALYYYQQAQKLRPYDSRMWTAMGKVYQSCGRSLNAIKCYQRTLALSPDDHNIVKELARLHKEVQQLDKAALFYEQDFSNRGTNSQDALEACAFLAEYYKSTKDVVNASKYAEILMNYGGKHKETAKMMLESIQKLNSLQSSPGFADRATPLSSPVHPLTELRFEMDDSSSYQTPDSA